MVKDIKFYKRFFSMMALLVLQNVIMLGVNLADNVMVSSYSENALSGVTAVNQVQFVLQQIIMGCSDALVSICSQYWGQGTNLAHKIRSKRRLFGVRRHRRAIFYSGGAFSMADSRTVHG